MKFIKTKVFIFQRTVANAKLPVDTRTQRHNGPLIFT